MKRVSTIIIVLFFSALQYAQTISVSGNIKDVKTNSPIENAKVQIKNINNGLIDSVFSDVTGNWQYDMVTSVEEDINYLPTSLEVMQNFPRRPWPPPRPAGHAHQ